MAAILFVIGIYEKDDPTCIRLWTIRLGTRGDVRETMKITIYLHTSQLQSRPLGIDVSALDSITLSTKKKVSQLEKYMQASSLERTKPSSSVSGRSKTYGL